MTHIPMKRGDTSPSLEVTLVPDIDLTGATVTFSARSQYGSGVEITNAPCVILQTNPGVVRYDWSAADTVDAVGIVYAEFQVTYGDGGVETFPNDGMVEVFFLEGV